jgi:hypothetical protein
MTIVAGIVVVAVVIVVVGVEYRRYLWSEQSVRRLLRRRAVRRLVAVIGRYPTWTGLLVRSAKRKAGADQRLRELCHLYALVRSPSVPVLTACRPLIVTTIFPSIPIPTLIPDILASRSGSRQVGLFFFRGRRTGVVVCGHTQRWSIKSANSIDVEADRVVSRPTCRTQRTGRWSCRHVQRLSSCGKTVTHQTIDQPSLPDDQPIQTTSIPTHWLSLLQYTWSYTPTLPQIQPYRRLAQRPLRTCSTLWPNTPGTRAY